MTCTPSSQSCGVLPPVITSLPELNRSIYYLGLLNPVDQTGKLLRLILDILQAQARETAFRFMSTPKSAQDTMF